MTRWISVATAALLLLLTGCATRSGQPKTPTPPSPGSPAPPAQQIGTACTAEIKANLGLYLNQGAPLPVFKDATLAEVAQELPPGTAILYYQADSTAQSLQMEYVNSQTGCWQRGFIKLGALDNQVKQARGASREIKDDTIGTKATIQAVQVKAETGLYDRGGNMISALPAGSWIGVREGESWESGASNHNLLLIHAYAPSADGTVWKVGASKDEFWFINLIDGQAKPEGYKVGAFGGQ